MRTAVRSRPRGTQVVSAALAPAPVGGWNARDPIAGMPPEDAVQLDNFIPRPGLVEARRGYAAFVTGLPAAVQSMLVWRGGGPGNDQQFAAAGTAIYPANAAGAVGSAVVSSLANATWQFVNFANTAGNFLIAVNGADTPLKYDGTSWLTTAITGASGPLTLDPTTLDNVMIFASRLMFSEAGTLRVWFLPVEDIAGAAQLLDLGPLFTLGGTLAGMAAWTQDGGMGPADQAVFVSTQGQIAVFQGTDPSDANNWSLVGVYTVGEPLGKRALVQYGADLVLLTTAGVLPLSQAAKYDRSQDENVALTAKIQNAFSSAIALYKSNFGWEALLYPAGQIAIYNVPVTDLGTSYQFVQNVQTGAWCRFLGLNAFCWSYCNGKIYFGSATAVNQWDTGSSDNGVAITCDMTGAFSAFKLARLKQFTMMRPIVQTQGTQLIQVDMLTDYRTTLPVNTPGASMAPSGMVWGAMVWGTMVWGSPLSLRLDWTTCSPPPGYVGAARLRTVMSPAASGGVYPEIDFQIIGFDVMYQPGGML